MSRSSEKISGLLSATSHMFYLSNDNKIFILRINPQQNTNPPIHIFCSLSNSLLPSTRSMCKTLLKNPPLGKLLTFSNLKRIMLDKKSSNDAIVMQLTKKSIIYISLPLPDNIQPSDAGTGSNLFTYRGIVTFSDSESGIYVLDKTLYMMTSFLCAVTNMPSIPLAATVTVHNAHLAKFRGHKWLILCGAGHIQLHQDPEDIHIHPAEEEINESLTNPFINILQDGGFGWTTLETLLLLDNYRNMEHCFSRSILLDRLLRVSVSTRDLKRNITRSLTKEFLHHKDFCSLEIPTNNKLGVRRFISLGELRNNIVNNYSTLTEDENQEKEIDFGDQHVIPLIVGILQFDQNGTSVLNDKETSLFVVGNFRNVELGAYLEIEKLTISHGKNGQHFVIVHKFNILGNFQKVPSTIPKTNQLCKLVRKSCLVLSKSSVMRDDSVDNKYFLILCEEKEEGKMILRIEMLEKYFLITQDRTLSFSCSSNVFKKIEQFSSEEFEVKNLVGQIPWFKVRENVTLDIEEDMKSIPALKYTLVNADLIPIDEMVNIEALVVSVEEDGSKHLNERSCKILLVLTAHLENDGNQYNFYLSLPGCPPCLLPGTLVEVTSVIKTLSKKGQMYFVSTYFTAINFLSPPMEDPVVSSASNLVDLDFGMRSIVEQLMSVERVKNLVVMVECVGCNSTIVSGRCPYIGCNVDRNYEFTFKATFEVLCNDNFASLVSLVEEDILVILNCPSDAWKSIKKEATLIGKLCLKDSQTLQKIASAAVATSSYVCIRARRMLGETSNMDEEIKLFCLKAWRLETRELNIMYEQLLSQYSQ